jgi:hypothetical protein
MSFVGKAVGSGEKGRRPPMEISDMVSEENCTQGWTCGGGRTTAGPSEELVKRDGPMSIMMAELSSNLGGNWQRDDTWQAKKFV